MGDYGGESNAKKLARGFLWSGSELTNRALERPGEILVLCGPEAADVRTLRGLLVNPARVIAVDRNLDSIEASRKLVPEATYVHGDIFDVVKARRAEAGEPTFSVMFLDFCGTMNQELLRKCIDAANVGLVQNGVLAIGAMYGRETGEAKERIKANHSNKNISPNMQEAPAKRFNYLVNVFQQLCCGSKTIIFPITVISYRSGRRVGKRSVGVPMLYVALRVFKLRRYQGARMWLQQWNKLWLQTMSTITQENLLWKHVGDDPDGKQLKGIIHKMDYGHDNEHEGEDRLSAETVADMFNVSSGTVAAWRAWETRRRRQEKQEKGK